jgi:hypothetical protein
MKKPSVTGLGLSIPFERDVFTFFVPCQFSCSAGLPFSCPGLRFVQALCGTAVEDGRKPPAQPAPSVLEGGATTTPPCGPAGRSTLLCGIVLSLCPFEPAPLAGVSLLSGVGARPPPYGV